MIEGVVLFNDGTNPYIGDMFHESPLVLLFFSWITRNISMQWINLFFICCDMLTSYILYKASKVYLFELVSFSLLSPNHLTIMVISHSSYLFQFQRQKQDKVTYADDVDEALLKDEDSIVTPLYVLSAYLFNPYCILNCVAKTTTVLSNLFLSFVFYSMLKGNLNHYTNLSIESVLN